MKDNLKICGIQMESRAADLEYNIKKAITLLEKTCKEYEPDLIVFPETVTTGFATGLSASELSELVGELPGKITEDISKAAKDHKVHVVWPSYERAGDSKVYNSAALIGSEGEIIGVYRKIHPFTTELEWTVPGAKVEVYDTSIGKISMMICFDGDFSELARIMGLKGAEIIARPSAFLRSFDTWKLTNTSRAYDARAYMIAVNQIGKDAGDSYYYGHSMIVSPQGHRIAQALCKEEIIFAELDNKLMNFASYGDDSPMLTNNISMRNPAAYGDILK